MLVKCSLIISSTIKRLRIDRDIKPYTSPHNFTSLDVTCSQKPVTGNCPNIPRERNLYNIPCSIWTLFHGSLPLSSQPIAFPPLFPILLSNCLCLISSAQGVKQDLNSHPPEANNLSAIFYSFYFEIPCGTGTELRIYSKKTHRMKGNQLHGFLKHGRYEYFLVSTGTQPWLLSCVQATSKVDKS